MPSLSSAMRDKMKSQSRFPSGVRILIIRENLTEQVKNSELLELDFLRKAGVGE